ncbi:nucleoporin 62 like isoform X1 [Tachysurus fulvidraco]|uniref:nucleoporin 62 like isoform X1 n=1 Tax=Tachysurus fulvidraco TaxID=1234273 RepID=UPI001FF06D77|nr:nucleoporin 62 like isoform X1 [Tachysurus fulvidraco]
MSFSFGQAAPGGGFSFGAPKTTASVTAAPGFSLQTSSPAPGGFSFGAVPQQPSQTQAGTSQIAGLLAQTTTSTGAPQGGFSFGASAQSSTTGGGFNFGGAPKLGLNLTPSSQPATSAVTLGGLVNSTTSASGTGFMFGGLAPQTTAPTQQSTGGFGFPGAKIQAPAATLAQSTPSFSLGGQSMGLTLGAVAPAAAATTTGINFGIKPAATPVPASTAAAVAAAAAAVASQVAPGQVAPGQVAPISSLFSSPIPSAASTGFTLGGSITAAAPVASSAATVSTGLTLKSLGAAVTSAAATTAATTSFSLSLKPAASAAPAASTAVSTAAISAAPVMSYAQLESLINKWSSELEDQERHFLQQATQVNAWDRMLVENGEKITSLHKDMEKVKLDQRRLDQELDFILSQQKELEDLLTPLEESVKEQTGTIYMQNADEERERTYKLAENVDAQLKRMSQDLKEIIEHLNTSNRLADTSDPLQQICKILNAHMDSLQWVEQNSVLLQRRVEEVSKLCESRSREQEKSFRLSFQ